MALRKTLWVVLFETALKDMKQNDPDFQRAFKFAFDEIYGMLKADLDRIFRIGTQDDKNGSKGGLNLSACALVLLGIEAMSKFETFGQDGAKNVEIFVNKYFPFNYKNKFKEIFLEFRHGLLHHFYPKSLRGIAKVTFLVDKDDFCWRLADLQKAGTMPLHHSFEVERDGTIHVIPQVLYLDFQQAVENFRNALLVVDANDKRKNFYENYASVKKRLGHKP